MLIHTFALITFATTCPYWPHDAYITVPARLHSHMSNMRSCIWREMSLSCSCVYSLSQCSQPLALAFSRCLHHHRRRFNMRLLSHQSLLLQCHVIEGLGNLVRVVLLMLD